MKEDKKEDKNIKAISESENEAYEKTKSTAIKNNENSVIKKELDNQGKIEVKIVLSEKEKTLVASNKSVPDVSVCINGYTYQIKKGVTVKVPKSVALVLEEAGLI